MMRKQLIKVLLVEDNETDYLLTSQYLADHHDYDFDIEWKKTFDDGLERVVANGYDVCLLDYNLGDKNGVDLANQARERGCTNPIILFSGITQSEMQAFSESTDIEGFLSKDNVSPEKIIKQISNVLVSDTAHTYTQHNTHAIPQALDQEGMGLFILENLPEPVMALNDEGDIKIVNRCFADLMAMEPEDILGINASLLLDCTKEELQSAMKRKNKEHSFRSKPKEKGLQKSRIFWKLKAIENSQTPIVSAIAIGSIKRTQLSRSKKRRSLGIVHTISKFFKNPAYIRMNGVYFHSDIFK